MLFESIPSGHPPAASASSTIKKDIIRMKFEKLFGSKSSTEKLTTDELTQLICRITTFYQKLLQTLTELRLQILCGSNFQLHISFNKFVFFLHSSFITRFFDQ